MTFRAWVLLAVVVLAVGFTSLAWVRCEGTPPSLEAPESVTVGRAGRELALALADSESGLVEASAVLVHARGETPLVEQRFPSSSWLVPRGREQLELRVALDPEALELPEGDAFLRVSARDASWTRLFRGNVAVWEIPVRIDLTPPDIALESGLTYVQRGGAAAVVYRVSEPVPRDAVEVADTRFRGFPFPGSDAGLRRLALFVIPVDAPAGPRVRVVAEDEAANRSAVRVAARVQERSFERVRIPLSRGFLEGKVMELAASLGVNAEDPVAAFQAINTRIRARDEARIRELARQSSPERLFRGAFQQLPGSQVTSRFAERREYLYGGRKISEATHYGYDLATVAGGPVTAAARGRVIHAGDLGIYGRCVLIDHGIGLVSLYGHLSQLGVSVGDLVERGGTLGRSGQTGLAGGDHLHFAILVDGVYSDPVEWWDPKWVREHVEVRLAPAP